MDEKRKKQLSVGILLIGMPMIVIVSAFFFPLKSYAAASVMMAFLSCVLLLLGFDKHTTHVRRVVLIAVMTGLSVLSRLVFAAVPGFKPVTAIVVLTAMYLGKEAGFMTGAFTALISNIFFGQGPYTPFQMLSLGFIGCLAGVFQKKLKKKKVWLMIYGVLAGIFYSMLMDIWTVLWMEGKFVGSVYLAAIGTAIPYTVMYAVSNVVFLMLLAEPFSRKMNRLVTKYRI